MPLSTKHSRNWKPFLTNRPLEANCVKVSSSTGSPKLTSLASHSVDRQIEQFYNQLRIFEKSAKELCKDVQECQTSFQRLLKSNEKLTSDVTAFFKQFSVENKVNDASTEDMMSSDDIKVDCDANCLIAEHVGDYFQNIEHFLIHLIDNQLANIFACADDAFKSRDSKISECARIQSKIEKEEKIANQHVESSQANKITEGGKMKLNPTEDINELSNSQKHPKDNSKMEQLKKCLTACQSEFEVLNEQLVCELPHLHLGCLDVLHPAIQCVVRCKVDLYGELSRIMYLLQSNSSFTSDDSLTSDGSSSSIPNNSDTFVEATLDNLFSSISELEIVVDDDPLL